MHFLITSAILVAAVIVPYITVDGERLGSDIYPVTSWNRTKRGTYCQQYRQWQCRDGTCISSDAKCDGVEDCLDKSDETFATCRHMRCQENWFRCTYGACVASTAACNGVKDCADNSDELLPACKNQTLQFGREFKCTNGKKMSASARCDGVKDCEDGLDESLFSCGRIVCPSYYFQCAYGACVDRGADCNGKIECADGSDEDDILCNRTKPLKASRRHLSKKCLLPPYPAHGSYVTNGMAESPGHLVGDVLLNFTCNKNYRLVGESQVSCKDGEWLGEFPKCSRFCKMLQTPNIKYRCLLSGDSVGTRKCEEYEPLGTQVSHECATNYRSDDEDTGYMECLPRGWVNVPRCLPDCGRVTPSGEQLIITGRQAKTGELPWHAGIFSKTFKIRESTVLYKQICGGSLISTTVVLSAAHCFWDDTTPLPATNYAVAVGKLYREWRDARDNAQHSDVKHLYLPDLFMGQGNQFQSDLAILVLAKRIQYAPHIAPVCISFKQSFANDQLRQGNLGKVAGWGLTEVNGGASPELKVVELPYVEPGMCKYKSAEQFKRFITADKFCAGYDNGTALCHGDSGGGLVFKKSGSERYYLRGIVSTAHQTENKCNSMSYTTFTNIITYANFIRQHWHADDY